MPADALLQLVIQDKRPYSREGANICGHVPEDRVEQAGSNLALFPTAYGQKRWSEVARNG